MNTKDPSWIYFVQRGDGLIKIGFSSDPRTRLQTLTGEHGVLRSLLLVSGGRAEEREFHDRFSTHRVTGEWFRTHEEVLDFIFIYVHFDEVFLDEIQASARQTAFRLPVSLLARLDRYAKRMRDEQKGLNVTRADVVRLLLTRALDDLTYPNKET